MAALITGASSGIGLDIARVVAANGQDVVLVARSADKLERLQREVEAAGTRAYVVPADLSAAGAALAVVRRVSELGLDIDVLVNNAGVGQYGPFLDTSLDAELDIIRLNAMALTELTKRLLPSMVARRKGRILNVASTAAFFPGPLMAVYYATKAYALSLSEALAEELEGTGVTVTVLCPGPTETAFQARAGMEASKLVAGKKLRSSLDVARSGYEGMMRGDRVVIPGLSNKLGALLPRIMTRRGAAKLVHRLQERV
jgi:short-subunit dehydrogenase